MATNDTASPNLAPGQVYFILMYADEALTIPVVQTLIYVGNRVRDDDGCVEHRFREIKPHGQEGLFAVREESLDQLVLDQRGLIERIQCGSRAPEEF